MLRQTVRPLGQVPAIRTMTLEEATEFLRPAIVTTGGTWVDLGAGNGTFSKALAVLLGESGFVLAVDRDNAAIEALRRVARRRGRGAPIQVARGDLQDADGIAELHGIQLDGALFANVLHYLPEPEHTLKPIVSRTRAGGRVVVVEYERQSANRWVPYPLPLARLRSVTEMAGLSLPVIVSRRPSAYQGEMYCAVTLVPALRSD